MLNSCVTSRSTFEPPSRMSVSLAERLWAGRRPINAGTKRADAPARRLLSPEDESWPRSGSTMCDRSPTGRNQLAPPSTLSPRPRFFFDATLSSVNQRYWLPMWSVPRRCGGVASLVDHDVKGIKYVRRLTETSR